MGTYLLGLAVDEAHVPGHLFQRGRQPSKFSGQLQPAVVGGRRALGVDAIRTLDAVSHTPHHPHPLLTPKC